MKKSSILELRSCVRRVERIADKICDCEKLTHDDAVTLMSVASDLIFIDVKENCSFGTGTFDK